MLSNNIWLDIKKPLNSSIVMYLVWTWNLKKTFIKHILYLVSSVKKLFFDGLNLK